MFTNLLCSSAPIHMLPTRTQDQAHHCPKAAWDTPLPPSNLHSTHTRPTATESGHAPSQCPGGRMYLAWRVWILPKPPLYPTGPLLCSISPQEQYLHTKATNLTRHSIIQLTLSSADKRWKKTNWKIIKTKEKIWIFVPLVIVQVFAVSLWYFTWIKKQQTFSICGTVQLHAVERLVGNGEYSSYHLISLVPVPLALTLKVLWPLQD